MRFFPASMTNLAEEAYDRYFVQPLTGSWLFGITTTLFAISYLRLISLVIVRWSKVPADARFELILLTVFTPMLWSQVIVQHRRVRAELSGSSQPKRSLRAQFAMGYLSAVTMAYILLNLCLTITLRVNSRVSSVNFDSRHDGPHA